MQYKLLGKSWWKNILIFKKFETWLLLFHLSLKVSKSSASPMLVTHWISQRRGSWSLDLPGWLPKSHCMSYADQSQWLSAKDTPSFKSSLFFLKMQRHKCSYMNIFKRCKILAMNHCQFKQIFTASVWALWNNMLFHWDFSLLLPPSAKAQGLVFLKPGWTTTDI